MGGPPGRRRDGASSLRKSLKGARTKDHKERSQPSDRRHLGFLEKHKDYVKRARDYHRKEDHLRLLREKASMRNPDEFYFGMSHTQLRRGVHSKVQGSATGRPNAFSSRQLKEMDSQDLAHMEMARQMERKRIERMRGRLHLLEQQGGGDGDDYDQLSDEEAGLGGGLSDEEEEDEGRGGRSAGPTPSGSGGRGGGGGQHTLFVDDEVQVAEFDAARHFDTAPQLVGRAFNRPRMSQLSKEALVWAQRGGGGGGGSGAGARRAQRGSKAREAQVAEEAEALVPGEAVLRRAERRRQAQYRELANRMDREAKMGRIVDELRARKDSRGKGRRIKVGELKGEGPIAGGNPVPLYRWVKERKR